MNKAYAFKIAQNLFLYLNSFDQQKVAPGYMMVPTNSLEKWFDRFQRKYAIDPNFVFKSSD